MKKIIKIILLLVGLLILIYIGRNSVFPALDKGIYNLVKLKNLKTGVPPDNQETCLTEGGDWVKSGLAPKETCRFPSDDFNKFCLSGFQCYYGNCVKKLDLRNPSFFGSGRCPKYQAVYGCLQNVHFGVSDSGICRD
jgi:hypothetical protein